MPNFEDCELDSNHEPNEQKLIKINNFVLRKYEEVEENLLVRQRPLEMPC